mgnify:CR=1 FL=1
MNLLGRIDRVDTYETSDKVYVKIIDYKSGNTSFSLVNLYHGLQLQHCGLYECGIGIRGKTPSGQKSGTGGYFLLSHSKSDSRRTWK